MKAYYKLNQSICQLQRGMYKMYGRIVLRNIIHQMRTRANIPICRGLDFYMSIIILILEYTK